MGINLISILSIVVLVVYLEMGALVLWKNPSASLNRWFFWLAMGLALWSFGHVFFDPAIRKYDGFYLFKFSLVGAILFVPFFLRFVSSLTDYPRNNGIKKWLYRFFLIYGTLLLLSLLSNPVQIQNIFFINWIGPEPVIDWLFLSVLFYYVGSHLLIIFFLLRWRIRMRQPGEIAQFAFIFYPLVISMTLGVVYDLVLPMGRILGINHLSHISSIFWLGGVAFGIIRLSFFSLTPELAAEQVIDETQQVLFFCDLNGKVIRTNSFTAGLLKLRNMFIEGKNVASFFAEKHEMEKYLDGLSSSGLMGPAELTMRTSTGEHIAVSVSFILVKDSYHDVLGMMVYGQDNREAIHLRNEILIRQQIENKLRGLSEVLEARVKERSEQLSNSYKELQIKMTERLKVEEKIKSDISEKEVLINEIHNRVKNNMNLIIALINAQITRENPQKVNRKLGELAQRVRTILLVHHHLYLSLNYSEVDFSGFLKLLVSQLIDFYLMEDILDLDLELSDIFLDIDYAIPLGIIANEVISNALSHAYRAIGMKNVDLKRPILTIRFFQKDSDIHLYISDNGKGLPAKFNFRDSATNGLALVEALVYDQINGSFEIKSKEGTHIKIIFPLDISVAAKKQQKLTGHEF